MHPYRIYKGSCCLKRKGTGVIWREMSQLLGLHYLSQVYMQNSYLTLTALTHGINVAQEKLFLTQT